MLFLHGGGPGDTGWGNFSRNLGAFSERFRTLVVDLPQFGRSTKPAIRGGRLVYLAETIVEFVEAMDLGRVHLVGYSIGGGCALKVAMAHPGVVDRVVIVGGAGYGNSGQGDTCTKGVRANAEYFMGSGPSVERMARLSRLLVHNKAKVTDEMIKERYKESIVADVAKIWMEERRGTLEELNGELSLVHSPTLIIWGSEDATVPVENALGLLRGISGSRLYVFSECGHWVQEECSEEFNRIVMEFFT